MAQHSMRGAGGKFVSRQQYMDQIDAQIKVENERQAKLVQAQNAAQQIPYAPGTLPTPTLTEQESPLSTPEQQGFLSRTLSPQSSLRRQIERLRQQNARRVRNLAGNVRGGVDELPTPGGIGVPLTILLILFLAIVPVNGHTRLMWLWLAIGGNAKINPSIESGLTATALQIASGLGGGEFQAQSMQVTPNSPVVIPPNFQSMVISPEPQFTGHSIGGLDPRSYLDLLGGLNE